MTNVEKQSNEMSAVSVLARPHYLAGKYLAAEDLRAQQNYLLQRLRRHYQHLHGWGVICGLWVVPANDPRRPWAVQVCPGYAIDCCGNEILVSNTAVIDIRDYLWRQPGHQPVPAAYIAIHYVAEPVRPIPAKTPGCGCDDTNYRPSRIRDSFRVDVLWTLPESPGMEAFDLCQPPQVPCPECPEIPYVVLARTNLPANEADPIMSNQIDNF